MKYNNIHCVSKFKNQQIKNITLSRVKSSRKINSSLENICKQKWNEKLIRLNKTKTKLWDSEVYRFEKIYQIKNSLIINVSTIPLSIRLMMNNFTEKIQKLGLNYAPLGMFFSCFVLTKDCYFLFVKKSQYFYFDRKFAFIGGILSKTENNNTSKCNIFNEVKKEMKEEIGVINQNIDSLNLLGHYKTSNFNFCLLFKIKLNITIEEALNGFSNRTEQEIEKIIPVHKNNLQNFILQNMSAKDSIKFSFLIN